MAEISNVAVVGDFSVRPTYESDGSGRLDILARFDRAQESPGHDQMHYAPASFYTIDLYVLTGANNNTVSGCRVKAPWPFTIWAADVGCESAAGSAGTVDIFADDGTTDASILDAPEDVKTTAGTCVRVAPEVGSEEIAYGTELYVKQIGTGAGAMVGGQAHLYVQRL